MPKYPLEDLLRVRRFREDNAARELTAKRRQLEQAEEALSLRKQEAADYRTWRIRREDELYQEIMQQAIQRQDLDDLKLRIDALRAEEITLQERILQAEGDVAAAKEAVQQAHAAWIASMRDREKITEHKAEWTQAAEKEIEYIQDLELEDFKVRTPDEDDAEDEALSYD